MKTKEITRERAIAFISHLTGHGASVIDEVLQESTSAKGIYHCTLGAQRYSVSFSNYGKVIQLAHSFVGESTKIIYFNADNFKTNYEMNEKLWEDIKSEIREG